MFPGLLILLRALGTPDIGALRKAGIAALKTELRARMDSASTSIIAKALERLEEDGDMDKIDQPGPFVDKDGVSMTGNQMFVHQALFAIARTMVPSGEGADLIRDDHFASWGMTEASIVAGTSGSVAVGKVFDRLRNQIL